MDVATLGIRVTIDGDAVVIQRLDAVAAKGEQSAQKVTAAFTQTSSSIARMSAAAVTFRRQIDDTGASVARMSAPAVTGFRQMAVAEEQAAAAAGVHGLQLGRVNMELGTAAGRILGFNTAASRFVAMLGGAVGGYVEMIAIVGVIVALGIAYEKLTASTRKQREEQERLNKATQDYLDKLNRPAGDIGKQVENEQTKLDELAKRRTALQGTQNVGGFIAGGVNKKELAEIDQQIAIHTSTMRVLEVEQTRLTNASKEAAAQATLEVQHQQALNAAYFLGSAYLAKINADYKLRADLINNASQFVGEERVKMDAAAKGMHDATIVAAQLAAAREALNEQMEKSLAFWEKEKTALENTQPQWTLNERSYRRLTDELKELNAAHDGEIVKLGQENAARSKAQITQIADSIKQANKYSDDLAKIWRDGIAKITTDGFKSFLDFAEDLNQLFTRLLDKMAERARELGKEAGGAGYKALGIGVAGLSGFASGYSSGSAATGIAGGALAGSAFGAPGILVGALAGLTGGLLGGAQAAKQRRDAEEQLRASLEASARDIQHQMGAITDLAAAIADAEAQRQAALKADLEAYGDFQSKFTGKNDGSVTAALTATNKLYDDYIEWLKKQAEATKEATQAAKDAANETSRQNSHLRLLNATGQSDAAFQYQQSLELEKAIADGLSGIALSELIQAQWAEAAQREREKQTQILQDQLTSAQQAVDALQQVYDSLDQFSKSLNIGQYSPLSPRQKLDATRGQLGALYQAALGGDQQAAGQFSGVAQQFLDASRKYNASGAGYVLDFNSVSVMVDALKSKFGAQLTDAQKQVSLLQQQLDALKSIDNGIQTLVNRPGLVPQVPTPTPVGGGGGLLQPIVGITADAQVSAAGFQIVADKLDALTDAVESGNNTTRRSIDSLTSATLKAS